LAGIAIVLTSTWIALSEFFPVSHSWDGMMYQKRRAELSDILGSPQEYGGKISPEVIEQA
ncbi:MAG TPA: hypothetical protein VLB12_13890, partial [Gemmatimonadales bacterium]|nr:hypothetical protein [Gemmatimonadales bacterium]